MTLLSRLQDAPVGTVSIPYFMAVEHGQWSVDLMMEAIGGVWSFDTNRQARSAIIAAKEGEK